MIRNTTAVVIDNNDPERLGRVQVRFDECETGVCDWAPVLVPAEMNLGLWCLPDVDDRVVLMCCDKKVFVVGFLWHNDSQVSQELRKPPQVSFSESELKALRKSRIQAQVQQNSRGIRFVVKDEGYLDFEYLVPQDPQDRS